jgi:hypothetical protein
LTGADENAVYDVCTMLLEKRTLDDATYGRAVEHLGEAGVVELVSLVGYYVMVCITLAAFKVAPAPGAGPTPFS